MIAIDTKTVDSKAKQGDKKFLIDYIEEIKEADYTAYATEILSKEMLALTIGFVDGKEQKEIVDAIAEKITHADLSNTRNGCRDDGGSTNGY